jgi:uncharacterized protein
MGKFIVLVVLLLVAFWLVRRALVAKRPGPPPAAGAAGQGELVSCAHCGVHLPRAEARLAGDRVYCTDEHARLGPRQG